MVKIAKTRLISYLLVLVSLIVLSTQAFNIGESFELSEPSEPIKTRSSSFDDSLGAKAQQAQESEDLPQQISSDMPGTSSAPARLPITVPEGSTEGSQITLTKNKSDSSLLSKLGSKLSAIRIFSKKPTTSAPAEEPATKPTGFDTAQSDLNRAAQQITPQAFETLIEKEADAVPDAQVRKATTQAIRLSNDGIQKSKILLEQIGKGQLVSEDAITSMFKDLEAAAGAIDDFASQYPGLRMVLINNNILDQLSDALRAATSVASLAIDNRANNGYPTYMITSYPAELSTLRAKLRSF